MAHLLLHNPRCSKSRQALALLEERGIEHEVRLYLEQPLSLDELRILKKRLNRDPVEWIRWGEKEEVVASGISKDDGVMPLLQAIADYPKLMERPILIHEDDALVGRPGPEALEALL